MPRYYDKATNLFKAFEPNGFKGDRYVQLTILDESALDTPATENEIKAAKHSLFCKLSVGTLSCPASNGNFGIRYAVSILGSRLVGWSIKHLAFAIKLFEYCLTTKEMGLWDSSKWIGSPWSEYSLFIWRC